MKQFILVITFLMGFYLTSQAESSAEENRKAIEDLQSQLDQLKSQQDTLKKFDAKEEKSPDLLTRLNFSGDLMVHAFTEKNALFQKANSDWVETIARLQATASLEGGHETNIRIVSTSTVGNDQDSYPLPPFEDDKLIADTLNVNFKNLYGQPLDVKIGRQEVILGTGFIVGDAYTDTVAEFNGALQFFDGIRATYYNLDDVAIDAYWLRVNDDRLQFTQNLQFFSGGGQLYGLEVRHQTARAEKWAVGILSREDQSVFENDTVALYLRGARSLPWIEGLEFNFEFVKQYGNTKMKDGVLDTSLVDSRRARDSYGGYFDLIQRFNNVAFKPWLRSRYIIFSGDKNKTSSKNEAFEPLFYDWNTWGHSVLDNSNASLQKYTAGFSLNEQTSLEVTWLNYYFHRQRLGTTTKHFAEGHNFVLQHWFNKSILLGATYALLDPSHGGRFVLGEDRTVTQSSFWVFTHF